jgi:kelch-like protein 10
MRNFEKVSQQSDELLELPPEELKAIIGADEVIVKSEEVVWSCVLRWINHDKESRKGKIVELIKKVRLGLLDPKFVLENVKNHPHVVGNCECCAIIMSALKSPLGLEMITEKDGEIPDREFSRRRIQYETLFVIAEKYLHSYTNYILIYDTRKNRWVEVKRYTEISERRCFGSAVIGFNIYFIGGTNNYGSLKSCLCFNAMAKTWCEVSSMHERRTSFSVAVLDGLVYAMGGSNDYRKSNTAERYDYLTNRWSMIAPMNEKRWNASATTLNGKIYVVGGSNDIGGLNSSEVYDPEVNQWTSIANMMSARTGLSCIAYHGYVYAIGGYNMEFRMCSGEKYNPTTNTWMQIPAMSHRRSDFGIAVLDDTIFAIGGNIFGLYRTTVEYYDKKSNKWITARGTNIPALRLSACVIMCLPNVTRTDQ